jgi:hypothetical protein
MEIKLLNSLSRQVEDFKPINEMSSGCTPADQLSIILLISEICVLSYLPIFCSECFGLLADMKLNG